MPITYFYKGTQIKESALQETAGNEGEALEYRITTPHRPLGSGSYGAVYAATVTCHYSGHSRYEGPDLVIKVQNYFGSEQERLELKQEAAFFERVHGGPVRYACPPGGSSSYLIMKRMPGRTLGNIMDDSGISWLVKLKLLDQVFATLHSQVHQKRIVHGDLSSNNIMVDLCDDGSFDVNVIDFGRFTQEVGGAVSKVVASHTYHHPERTIASGRQDMGPPANAQTYQDVYSLCYELSRWGSNHTKFAEFLRPIYRQDPLKPTVDQARQAVQKSYQAALTKKLAQMVTRLSTRECYELFKLILLNDQPQLRTFLNRKGGSVFKCATLRELKPCFKQFVDYKRGGNLPRYCEEEFSQFGRHLNAEERDELVKLILLNDQPQQRAFLAQRDAGRFESVTLEELKFEFERFVHENRNKSLRRYCCAPERSVSIAYGSIEQIRDCLPDYFKPIDDGALVRTAGFVYRHIIDEVQYTLCSAAVNSLNIRPDELRAKLKPHLQRLSNQELARITASYRKTLYQSLQRALTKNPSSQNLVLFAFGREIFPGLLKVSTIFKQLAHTLSKAELDHCWGILEESLLTPRVLARFDSNPPLSQYGWWTNLRNIQLATQINFSELQAKVFPRGVRRAVEKVQLELKVRFKLQKFSRHCRFCPALYNHWIQRFHILHGKGYDATLEQWSTLSEDLEDTFVMTDRFQRHYNALLRTPSYRPIAQNWLAQIQSLAERRNPIATQADWDALFDRITATHNALDLLISYENEFSNEEYNTVTHYWHDQFDQLNEKHPQATKHEWDELTRRIDFSFLTISSFCDYERGSRTTKQHYKTYALSRPESHNINTLCQLVADKTGFGCKLHKESFFICMLDTLREASQNPYAENHLAPLLESTPELEDCLARERYNDPTQPSSSFWSSSAGQIDRGKILQAVKVFAQAPARQLTHAEAAMHNLQALRA